MSITRAANARVIFINKETSFLKSTVGAALRGRPWLLAPTLILVLSLIAVGQPNRSIYTPIGDKQCRTIKSHEAGDDGFEARCRGTAGYSLLLSEGDLRQNITVITPHGAKHSLELWNVVSGGFSSVGPKAEWRLALQNGKLTPVGLIVRYNASEDPEKPDKQTSYLAVAKITSADICVTDKIFSGPKANEDARRAADAASSKPCLKAR